MPPALTYPPAVLEAALAKHGTVSLAARALGCDRLLFYRRGLRSTRTLSGEESWRWIDADVVGVLRERAVDGVAPLNVAELARALGVSRPVVDSRLRYAVAAVEMAVERVGGKKNVRFTKDAV
jgi:predicted SpoU family rRNA methylase